ncbi:hypothetical protein CHS0354_032347 [Potamilus streckersoni]|uniref:TIR domain-containing protein n=1 Tax=Potamilus streckersoni TaxID=2493646 RepID=A0AAE0TGK4_9BIVA|nr:hypothetical protein CHS0354_032347 [Potamilus streckersoni]
MGCGPSTHVEPVIKDNPAATQSIPVSNVRGNHRPRTIRNKQDSESEGYASDDSKSDTSQQDIVEMTETKTNLRSLIRTVSRMKAEDAQNLVKKYPELKPILKSFDHTISILSQKKKWTEDDNEAYLKEVQNTLKQNLLDNFQKFNHEEKRLVMGNHLVDKEFPKLLFEFYVYVFEAADIKAFDNNLAQEAEDDETLIVLMTIREIFWNFSDSCPAFSKAVAVTGIFKYLIDDLSAIKDDGLEVLEAESDPFAFTSAVAILHNCAHNPDTERKFYRDVNAVDSLLPYLESKQPKIQMVTLLALADMIDDNECDKIQGSENVFKLLRDMIEEARRADDRRKEGFCVSELIDGLLGLAKAEKNKTLIMDTKPLGIFCKVLEDGHEKELLSVCKVVRELAFNQNNIGKIKKEKGLYMKLTELQTHRNKDICVSARGAIFQLQEHDDSTNAGTPIGLPPIPDEETGTDVPVHALTKKDKQFPKRHSRGELPWYGPHIMISYNWDNQQEIIKIRDVLVDNDYNVWLDMEHMHTYMLDAMAQAVEKAFVVLVCFSEKYKLSQNCRAEAEYAFHKHKEIIPLKMQAGYNPDGWLGILLGPKLYYEFSEAFSFEAKVKDLLNAIDKLPNNPKYDPMGGSSVDGRSVHVKETKMMTGVHTVPDALNIPIIPDIVKWTKDEVNQWLRKSKLDPNKMKKLQSLTGEQLVFLKKVSIKAPEFFFRCLESKLGLDSLEDIMNLSNALEKLTVR